MDSRAEKPKSMIVSAFMFFELVYYSIVREVRTESGGAALGIVYAIMRSLTLVIIMYFMIIVVGSRAMLIRGDTMLYIMSGVFLFMVHNASMSKTVQGGNMFHSLMQHAPMTPMIRILSSALAALYIQVLAALLVLCFVFTLRDRVEIFHPAGVALAMLLAWAAGVVTGLMFLLVKPFAPKLVQLASTFYMRAMLLTSGKFFVANNLPASVLPYLQWNPLFHCIDFARGEMFVNYLPRNSDIDYVVNFILIGLVLGMMGEFWLRRSVSSSTAKRNG